MWIFDPSKTLSTAFFLGNSGYKLNNKNAAGSAFEVWPSSTPRTAHVFGSFLDVAGGTRQGRDSDMKLQGNV